MEILYKNKRVEQDFSTKYKKKWKYPKQVAVKLESLENFIIAAESLLDIANAPQYRWHRLNGNRNNEWSVSLGYTGYRVTMIPCNKEGKTILQGDIISQCKFIKIVLVTEVSNHYE